MQSILISSKDKKAGDSFAIQLCQQQGIDILDQNIVQNEKESIGIAAIRTLQKTLFLTPLKSKTKAVIIQDADTLTVEAQNALLKILEEPPNNTLIILVAQTHTAFLPTVISRCKIIELTQPKNEQKENLSSFIFDLSSLTKGELGERLKLAQDVGKNKDEALAWLEQTIILTHQKFLEKHTADITNTLEILNKAYSSIKTTNVNPRFTLENLFLSLS